MIYEMRVYRCVPGRLPALLKPLRQHHAQDLGEARHQASRLLHHADRRVQPGADLFPAWESLADRETKWNAFAADPEWHAKRAETEKDGPIVANVLVQMLTPTAFSSVK
jgi:hypothetical protein